MSERVNFLQLSRYRVNSMSDELIIRPDTVTRIQLTQESRGHQS